MALDLAMHIINAEFAFSLLVAVVAAPAGAQVVNDSFRVFTVHTPPAITRTDTIYGQSTDWGWQPPPGGVTGRLVSVRDINGSDLGCSPHTNPQEVEGQIALIRRGACTFVYKAVQADQAGARAWVIYQDDRVPTDDCLGVIMTQGDSGVVGLTPGGFLPRCVAVAILPAVASGVEVMATLAPFVAVLREEHVFMSPRVNANPSNSPTYAFAGSVVRSAGTINEWNTNGLRLEFGPNRSLVIAGTLNASDVTFTAVTPSLGWAGLRMESGASGTVESSTVELVASYGGAAVTINGSSPIFNDNTITADAGAGVDGFYITGGFPTLEDNLILGLSGDGIVMTGGATARLIQNVILNNAGIGLAAHYLNSAFLGPPPNSSPTSGEFGNRIEGNIGRGVYARSSSVLTFGYYYYPGGGTHADGFNSVTNNGAVGLYAAANARISAGTTQHQRSNRVFSNGVYDAQAVGASARVYASCDWWSDITPPFRISGLVDASYYLLADPYSGNPYPTCTDGGSNGLAGVPSYHTSNAGPGGRPEGTNPREWLFAAVERGEINPLAALRLLSRIIEEAPDDSPAQTAIAEVGYLSSLSDVAQTIRAEANAVRHAAVGSPLVGLRSAALRATVAAHQRAGDGSSALAAAHALIQGAPTESDVLFGNLATFYIYARAGQPEQASAALATIESLSPESSDAAEARRFFDYVVMADPDGLSAPPGVASASTEAGDADGRFSFLNVRPNPARGRALVPFVITEPAHVRIVAVDVTGREIAVLADGDYSAGNHALTFESLSRIATGTYLLYASVVWAGGPVGAGRASFSTQRMVILR